MSQLIRWGAWSFVLTLAMPAAPVGAVQRRAAPPRKPQPKPAPAKPAPAKPSPAPPAALTPTTLGAVLRDLGYKPAAHGAYQRIRVEEDGYGYFIDFSLSGSGEWLVCMAHLAPIPDLTKVPPSPLLALLATNDSLLGMSFSYNRASGQLMLNAAAPNRGLGSAALRNLVGGMAKTVRDTQGLWDPERW